MFSALSFNQGDLRNKVNLFIALCPILELQGSPNTMMQIAAKIWYALEVAAQTFGVYELGNPTQFGDMHKLCSWSGPFCTGLMKMFAYH